MGTLAYLTSQDTVTNTFTVGKVEITLDEAPVNEMGVVIAGNRVDNNEYKLIPGHNYFKDPTIHVQDGSEACWLFVKIENTNPNATINGLAENGWISIVGTDYWVYDGATVGANSNVKVFDSFTYANTVTDTTDDAGKQIVVTAYAIQADGFATWQDAWIALAAELSL